MIPFSLKVIFHKKTTLIFYKVLFTFGFCAIIFSISTISAQDTIRLADASFEFKASSNYDNLGSWRICEADEWQALYTHTNETALFNIRKKPTDGNACISLFARTENTKSYLTQEVSKGLKKGSSYKFTLDLCQEKNVRAKANKEGEYISYAKPIQFEIWGGNFPCEKRELLALSGEINHEDWQSYTFYFQVASDVLNYFGIGVNYVNEDEPPYNGNVLLDNLSDIMEVDAAEYKVGSSNGIQKKEKEKNYDSFENRQDIFYLIQDSLSRSIVSHKKLTRLSVLRDMDFIGELGTRSDLQQSIFETRATTVNWAIKAPRLLRILKGLQMPESEKQFSEMYQKYETQKNGGEVKKMDTSETLKENTLFRDLLLKEKMVKQMEWYISLNRKFIKEELGILKKEVGGME